MAGYRPCLTARGRRPLSTVTLDPRAGRAGIIRHAICKGSEIETDPLPVIGSFVPAARGRFVFDESLVYTRNNAPTRRVALGGPFWGSFPSCDPRFRFSAGVLPMAEHRFQVSPSVNYAENQHILAFDTVDDHVLANG
jgi:hypothetical protein